MNISQFLSSGGGKLRYQEFTSTGPFTPSSRLIANGGQCFVTALAGAGSGGAARIASATNLSQACGGDAGQLVEGMVTVSGATTVTIGAGGASVATTGTSNFNTNGNDGADTTFGALLTAKGGKGGVAFDNSITHSARGGDGVGSQGQYVTDTTTTLSARGGAGKNGKGGGGGGTATYGVSHMTATDGGGAGAVATSGNVSASNATANSGAGGGGVTLGLWSASSQTVTSGAGGSGWLRVVWFE